MSVPESNSPSPTAPAGGGTTRIVSIGRRQIRVDVRPGSGTATPLLVCNGIGASFEVLQPFVDALPPELEVIRFDAPGVGGSPVSRLPYGFPQLAWLLVRVLDELGYDQVDVLGLSWGGALAQQFAVQHRRRCRRLVLVSTATGMAMIPGNPRALIKMLSPRRFRDPELLAAMASNIYGGSADRHRDLLRDVFNRQQFGGSWRGYFYQLAGGACWTSLPFLWLVRQPTLVMGGDADPIVPAINQRILARLIPHSRLHVYRGGHVELVTEAADLAPVVSGFLEAQIGDS